MNTEVKKEEIPAGYIMDRDGRLVHKDRIKPVDKARDDLVKKLTKEARKVSGTIAEFREKSFEDIGAFANVSAEKYGAKLGGKKGNMTLFSFDGSLMIKLSQSENKSFDERLQIAKSLIDECIHEWMKGSNKNIQALVSDAFQVDKEGRVSTSKVMGLRRLDIEDPRWDNAMKAIADAVQVTGSKRYVRFYERVGDTEEYVPISLDAASA